MRSCASVCLQLFALRKAKGSGTIVKAADGSMSMQQRTQVWDIGIRAFHWSLVLFFTIAYLSGDDADTLHAYAGYAVITLLLFRLLWGLIGTRTARFTSFIYSPAETLRYAKSFVSRRPIHYVGHNPIGALMVFVLLFMLSLSCWTGLKAYAEQGKGPLAGATVGFVATARADDDHDKHKGGESEFWQEIHEAMSNLTLFLIFVHIGGVLLASLVHGENLIKSMITGTVEKITDAEDRD